MAGCELDFSRNLPTYHRLCCTGSFLFPLVIDSSLSSTAPLQLHRRPSHLYRQRPSSPLPAAPFPSATPSAPLRNSVGARLLPTHDNR